MQAAGDAKEQAPWPESQIRPAPDPTTRQVHQSPAQHPPAVPLVASGLLSTTPPLIDPQTTVQRSEESNALQHLLSETSTGTIVLTGPSGSGKSTLAGMCYRRMQATRKQETPGPRYLIWLTLASYTTLPDIISAILKGVEMEDAGLFLRRPEQQISTLLRALRRPQASALVVLDQFDRLLRTQAGMSVAGRDTLPTFLSMLQTDLGASRVLLTCASSPYEELQLPANRIRSYPLQPLSQPAAAALLAQRNISGSTEDCTLAWQRCQGHAFTLVLLSALVQQSDISLHNLLTSPTYQTLWAGDVRTQLIARIHRYLNPLQETMLQTLSLFHEAASPEGLKSLITGKGVFNEHGHDPTLYERELQRLTQMGLILPLWDATGAPGYLLHTILRQYLQEHFTDHQQRVQSALNGPPSQPGIAPNSDARQIALAAAHVQVANSYQQLIAQRCPPQEQRQSVLDVEPILHAIRHFCLGWRWQRACDLLFGEGLHEDMIQWGAWSSLLGLYLSLLPPLGVILRRDEGLIASHVAMLYGRMGEIEQSKTYFAQALAIQRQLADHQGEATTLTNQGELSRIQGEYEQARASFERAISLLSTTSDIQLRCILLHNLGLLFQQDKDYTQALQCYTEALQLATQLGKQQYLGMILTNLGILLYEQQQRQEGLALLLAALRVREMIHDPGVSLLERFLVALEQKMGGEAYTATCKAALELQPQIFARFAPQDMRQ